MSKKVKTTDKHLALELVRVTEAAAMAAARWMGRGDKEGADGGAVNAMRRVLDTVNMDGIVVLAKAKKTKHQCFLMANAAGTVMTLQQILQLTR